MKLQTIVPIHEGAPKIDYHSKVLLLGSCFSESIGEKLQYFKFDAQSNPFGVIFNPYSLEKILERVIQKRPFKANDLFHSEGLWRSFEVHSQWANTDREALLEGLNEQLLQLGESLKKTTHCIITLGTAWVYRYKESNEYVANCHKVPGTKFEKELLEVADIIDSLTHMVVLLESINPRIKVLFTVSPVRHIKDGFIENNRSKGRLLDAVQTVMEDSSADYFPSYEIMIDELRGYRFYADDLVHPNALGIQYIWEKFQQTWLAPSVNPLMNKIEGIQKSLAHRPMNPELPSAKEFRNNLEQKIEALRKELPHIDFP